MERKYDSQFTIHDSRKRSGSALILTVVLTTLLAIIAVVFLLASRIDKTAASAASENRELSFAIETTLEKISRELVFDVPGVASQEYHQAPKTDGWRRLSQMISRCGSKSAMLPDTSITDAGLRETY
jgi:hypothetical protein